VEQKPVLPRQHGGKGEQLILTVSIVANKNSHVFFKGYLVNLHNRRRQKSDSSAVCDAGRIGIQDHVSPTPPSFGIQRIDILGISDRFLCCHYLTRGMLQSVIQTESMTQHV
jgi:hypothetical protein